MTCQASATPTPGCYCACCGKPAQAAPADWIGQVNVRSHAFQGFVRNERFQKGTEQVIPGTNRAKTRAWRQIDRHRGA